MKNHYLHYLLTYYYLYLDQLHYGLAG